MKSRLSRLLLQVAPSPVEFDEGLEAVGGLEAAGRPIAHDPELTAHDDAVFLLHIAAEVEHALMVQYLYAAYSLKPTGIPPEHGPLPADRQALVDNWRREILSIAREEMGHLASVQNLLHLIGGPLNFEREDFPFRSGFYPFRFRLEPLTKDSLAKYVYAEMPEGLTGPDIDEIRKRAEGANEEPVIHVGLLYKAIADLFNRKVDGEYSLPEPFPVNEFLQADESWKAERDNLILNIVKTRPEATKLINDISLQGEGLEVSEALIQSHYRRFRAIYDAFPERDDWQPSLNMAINPSTIAPETEADVEGELRQDAIRGLKPKLWSQLFNLRYRRLLIDISHALHLHLNKPSEKTRRDILYKWIFEPGVGEMTANLAKIAKFLRLMPMNENVPDGLLAGAPFELPYALNLPQEEADRWLLHQDMIRASQKLTQKILTNTTSSAAEKTYLDDLVIRDAKDLELAKNPDAATPEPAQGPTPATTTQTVGRFTEVTTILEEAVGDIGEIGAHGHFWLDISRDDFIAKSVRGLALIVKKPDGTFDPDESNLIKALEARAPFGSDVGTPGANRRRMPAGLPPVPPEKIAIIRKWITDGCPDNAAPQAAPLSFAADIKNLFRAVPDRSAMMNRPFNPFDLHKFEDVRDRADLILEKLVEESMPCDNPWPAERIDIFRKWINDGKNP